MRGVAILLLIFTIIFAILIQPIASVTCQFSDTENTACSTCCDYSQKKCADTIYKCPITSVSEFHSIYQVLLAIACFIIGVPILMAILDFFITGRIFGTRMSTSIGELIARYICCCLCLNQQARGSKSANYKPVV